MVQIGFRLEGTESIVHDLTRFQVNLNMAQYALEDMGDVIAESQRRQFDTEGRHYGSGWAALTAKYAAQKARTRPGHKILDYNGTLRNAAAPTTGRGFSFYKVSNRRLEVGVSYSAVPYAEYHQNGTEHMPARPIIGEPTRADRARMTKILHTLIMGGTKHARS